MTEQLIRIRCRWCTKQVTVLRSEFHNLYRCTCAPSSWGMWQKIPWVFNERTA